MQYILGGNIMSKGASVYAHIDSDIKAQAEEILSELGISISVAINIYYRQIIRHGGLPFEVVVSKPTVKLPELSDFTKEEFEERLRKSYQDCLAGNGRPLDEVMKELMKDL